MAKVKLRESPNIANSAARSNSSTKPLALTQPHPGQPPDLLRRLLRAKDRMDAASHQQWPVQRLSRVSCISQAHFARCFKEAFGVPPHRYLITRRIERAIALLRDTDLPVTQIAFRTGWESLGTFGRTFRQITGQSPRILREQLKSTRHTLQYVPECVLRALHRPDLKIAVSEKRRLESQWIKTSRKSHVTPRS